MRCPALLLAVLCGCAGQTIGPRRTLLPAGGAELPAELARGVWLADVELGAGLPPQRFLIDTGTDRTLLDVPLARRLGLDRRGDGALLTATGRRLPITLLAALPALACGAAEFRDVDVASIDLEGLRTESGLPITGILGCDLFRQGLLELDYPRRRARLEPLARAPTSGGHAFTGRVPWVESELAGVPLRFLVDTGFQQALSLPPGTVLPWRRPPARAGELATLDGTLPVAAARVRGELVVGALRWRDPQVVLAAGAPKLGARLLAGCVLRLDAGGGRIWLEPGARARVAAATSSPAAP